MTKTKTLGPLRAYACSVKGSDWGETIVRARSQGKAKVSHWHNVRESWQDVPYTAVRARVTSSVPFDAGFARNAKYRGIEFAKIGMRVRVAGMAGVIVGHNSSANLDVLFDESGWTLNCHPHSDVTYFADSGEVIRTYDLRGTIIFPPEVEVP